MPCEDLVDPCGSSDLYDHAKTTSLRHRRSGPTTMPSSSPLSSNYSKPPHSFAIQNTGHTEQRIFPLKHRLKPEKLKFFLFLSIFLSLPSAQSIKCFCTDDHCVPAYGVCESNVGLRRPDLTMSHLVANIIWSTGWTLCACDQPFCNTFSYLRELTQDNAFPPPPLTANAQPQMQHDDNDANYLRRGSESRHRDLIIDDDTRIFQRVDGPPGEYIDEHGMRRQATLSTRTSLLTLLLVIVPVSVGAATILVVSFNYYCHLC
ncbi:hypothetical protein M3Y97_01046500 [Aphelenchoides bicaudatus]|nr:hypothetical protein M3Y97_01046500 [Aphelenchoides bicaudatus]